MVRGNDRRLITAVLSVAPFLAGGCAATFHGLTQEVEITSDPPGAAVTVGERLAPPEEPPVTTPTFLSLSRDEDYTLVVEKEGYRRSEIPITHHLSRLAFLNCCFLQCSPVCMSVDAATGSMWYLTPDDVHVTLTPAGGPNDDSSAVPRPTSGPPSPGVRRNATPGFAMEAGLGPAYAGEGLAIGAFVGEDLFDLEGMAGAGYADVQGQSGGVGPGPPDNNPAVGFAGGARLLVGGRFRFLLGASYGHQTSERACLESGDRNCGSRRQIYGPSYELGYMYIDDSGFLFSITGGFSRIDTPDLGNFRRYNLSVGMGFKPW